MLWALGAWAAWAFLRDWPQAALAAMITPAWLASEWFVATKVWYQSSPVLTAGLLLLAISYITAILPEKNTPMRKTLVWIGGLTLIPAAALVTLSGKFAHWHQLPMPWHYHIFGWVAAYLFPLALAWWLRGKHVWLNVVAAFWVAALTATSLLYRADYVNVIGDMISYALCALGSIGLIAWGLKEDRKERVNLGIAGFALTVLFFYFSALMDKLGRSVSLIGLGLLFLLGGWLLEKVRRRLISKIGKGAL